MFPFPFCRDHTHLVGSETFYGENPVMVVEEFGVDRRIWQEEAAEVNKGLDALPDIGLTRREPRRRR
jgi:hypothetical protein